MSKICLCLTASTIEDAIRQLDENREFIQMAEVRLDLLNPEERPNVPKLVQRAKQKIKRTMKRKPNKKSPPNPPAHLKFILTARLPRDGGQWGRKGETEAERRALLSSLLREGIWDFVDLEWQENLTTSENPATRDIPHNENGPIALEDLVREAKRHSVRVIRSLHDFSGTMLEASPTRSAALIRDISAAGAIPKLALTCKDSRDLLTLARLSLASGPGEKVILGMGEYGIPSRILSGKFGSAWTYASAGETSAAPGQLSPETLENLYRFSEIHKQTPLYAVIGNPVSHSRSPEIHNRWLKENKLPGTYIPMRVSCLGAALETSDILGIKGLSVTVPHKESALRSAGIAAPNASKIGAANTLLRYGDGFHAENTDGEGFLIPLLNALKLQDRTRMKQFKTLIIGTGGASRAVVHTLADLGTPMIILNRSPGKARLLAGEAGAQWGPLSPESLPLLEAQGGVDLAIQTTPAGMHPLEHINPVSWWNPAGLQLACDLIYEPAETLFLKQAREAGVLTLNGDAMLEAQARRQFELFTKL